MSGNEANLRAGNPALVVIDMQEKLVPAMREMHSLVSRTETLLRGCALLDIPVLFTQQYTKGLGETIQPVKDAYVETAVGANKNVRLAAEDQRVPRERMPFSYIEKTSFSVMGEPAFVAALERTGRREVILCGVEAHVCVLQSAEELSELGYAVTVAADATSSRRKLDADFAYSRMTGKGITVTTAEALLFDLLRSAKHPMFRWISALVK
jgi:nicotinamidase-related amidase